MSKTDVNKTGVHTLIGFIPNGHGDPGHQSPSRDGKFGEGYSNLWQK